MSEQAKFRTDVGVPAKKTLKGTDNIKFSEILG